MLKKYLVSSALFLFLFLPTYFMKGMEETILDEQYSDGLEFSLTTLEGMPLEMLDLIISCFDQKNFSDNSIDSAQLLYNETRDLRLTSHYFNQIIENLIINRSMSRLKDTIPYTLECLRHCHPNNYLGAALILISFLGSPYDYKEDYKILKRYFFAKIIIPSPDKILQYNFYNCSATDVKLLIDVLKKIEQKIKNDLNYASPIEDSIIIDWLLIIASAIQNNNKDVLQTLAPETISLFYSLHNRKSHLLETIIKGEKPNIHDLSDLTFFIDQNYYNWGNLDDSNILNPLKWAIIFDNTKAISSILYYLRTNFAGRNIHAEILKILNFASTLGAPETLRFLLFYCGRYKEQIPNKDILEYFKDSTVSNNHPLQKAFDAGNEENFMVLVHHDADLSKLIPKETKANVKSALFKKIIEGKKFAVNTQKALKQKRGAQKNIAPKTIINDNPKKKWHNQKVLFTLGAAVIGLAAYQIFSKSPNYIKFATLCREKI